jgi:hypothetical protein
MYALSNTIFNLCRSRLYHLTQHMLALNVQVGWSWLYKCSATKQSGPTSTLGPYNLMIVGYPSLRLVDRMLSHEVAKESVVDDR